MSDTFLLPSYTQKMALMSFSPHRGEKVAEGRMRGS
jgi:hypothetical protein